MDGFLTDREKAFEAKYQFDQELAFKVAVRRNKLLGLWAAERLGLTDKAAADYARSVVSTGLKEQGLSAVVKRLMEDLKTDEGVALDPRMLAHEIDRLEAQAHREVEEGHPETLEERYEAER